MSVTQPSSYNFMFDEEEEKSEQMFQMVLYERTLRENNKEFHTHSDIFNLSKRRIFNFSKRRHFDNKVCVHFLIHCTRSLPHMYIHKITVKLI